MALFRKYPRPMAKRIAKRSYPLSMGKKTQMEVRKLKKVVKRAEVKEIATSFTLNVTNANQGVIPQFRPPSGDDNGQRTGNKIMLKWIKIKIRMETTEQNAMRYQIITPKTGSATASTVAVLFDSTQPALMDSTYNNHYVNVDRTVRRTMSNTGVLVPIEFHFAEFKYNINKEWLFESGTTADPVYAPGIKQINFIGATATVIDNCQGWFVYGYTDD